jgi:hypothetical protein
LTNVYILKCIYTRVLYIFLNKKSKLMWHKTSSYAMRGSDRKEFKNN